MRGRIALTCHQCGAVGSAGTGREERVGGGGFFWAKQVRRQLGIGPDGEISCAPILTSSFMHMTLVYVTTPSFPVYRAYLKILVFPFYKDQFGCSPSQV